MVMFMNGLQMTKPTFMKNIAYTLFLIITISFQAISQDENTPTSDSLKVSAESTLAFLNETQLIIDGDTVNYSDLDSATTIVIMNRKKAKADEEYNLGVQKLAKGNAKEAIPHFTEAIRLAPNFALAYANQGVAFMETKRKNLALINFRSAIELDPKHADIAYFNRGKLLASDGKTEEAFKDYTAAINANTKFAEAYYERGVIYFQRNAYEQAKSDFEHTVQYAPKHAYAWNDLGSTKRQLGDLKGAETAYSKAIGSNSQLAFVYNNRGSTRVQLKKFDEAISDFSKSLKLEPSNHITLNNRGSAHFEKGNYKAAIKDFSSAIQLNTSYAFAYNNRAAAKFKIKDYQGAISDCDQAIKLAPDYAYAFINRANAKEMIRNPQGACTDWKTAAKLGIKTAQLYLKEECKERYDIDIE